MKRRRFEDKPSDELSSIINANHSFCSFDMVSCITADSSLTKVGIESCCLAASSERRTFDSLRYQLAALAVLVACCRRYKCCERSCLCPWRKPRRDFDNVMITVTRAEAAPPLPCASPPAAALPGVSKSRGVPHVCCNISGPAPGAWIDCGLH